MAPPRKPRKWNRKLASQEPTKAKESRWNEILRFIFVLAATDPNQVPLLGTAMALSLVSKACHTWMRTIMWETVHLRNNLDAEHVLESFTAFINPSPLGLVKNLWAATYLEPGTTSQVDHSVAKFSDRAKSVGTLLSFMGLEKLAVNFTMLHQGWFDMATPKQILLVPSPDPWNEVPINLAHPAFREVTHLIIGHWFPAVPYFGLFGVAPLRHCKHLTHICIRFHTSLEIKTSDVFAFTVNLLRSHTVEYLVCYVDDPFRTQCPRSSRIWEQLKGIAIRIPSYGLTGRMIVLTSAPTVKQEWRHMVSNEHTPWIKMQDPAEQQPLYNNYELHPENWKTYHGRHLDENLAAHAVVMESEEERGVAEDMEVNQTLFDDLPDPPDLAEYLLGWKWSDLACVIPHVLPS